MLLRLLPPKDDKKIINFIGFFLLLLFRSLFWDLTTSFFWELGKIAQVKKIFKDLAHLIELQILSITCKLHLLFIT